MLSRRVIVHQALILRYRTTSELGEPIQAAVHAGIMQLNGVDGLEQVPVDIFETLDFLAEATHLESVVALQVGGRRGA